MGRLKMVMGVVASLVMWGCSDGGGGTAPTPAPVAPTPPAPQPPPPPQPPPEPPADRDLHFVNIMAMTQDEPGRMIVHATVRYRDNRGSVARRIGYLVRRDNGEVLAQGSITQLEPGEARLALMTVDGIIDRELLTMVVDQADTVAEANEENNSLSVTAVFGEQPNPSADRDLLFSDCHYHGVSYYRDPRLHFFIMNPNQRGVDAQDVAVAVQINGIQSWSGSLDRVPAPTPEQLAAGSYQGREVTLTTRDIFGADQAPIGRQVLTVLIDPDNAIVEQNEANNYRRLVIEVDEEQQITVVPTTVPDIQIEDPHFQQFVQSTTWRFWISNVSLDLPGQSVAWRLVREDGLVIQSGAEEVGSQQLKEVLFDVPKDGDAEMRYRLILDPDNTIRERDEGNNVTPFIVDWTPEFSG